MERPFESVLNIFSENLEKAVKYDRQSHEFLHSFTLWLTGFSIGALSLLFSNIADLGASYSHASLKALIWLLSISVVSGVLHRLYLFAFQVEYNSNLFYIEGAFSNKKIMPSEPSDITNETDIKVVVNLIMDDFNEDLSHVLEAYKKADELHRQVLLQSVKDHYSKVARWSVRDYQIGFDYVNSVLKSGFGLSDKEIKRTSDVSGSRIRKLRLIQLAMLYISYLSFILAIIFLAIRY